jgi:U3 small nucleolar RNA-associated protein 18
LFFVDDSVEKALADRPEHGPETAAFEDRSIVEKEEENDEDGSQGSDTSKEDDAEMEVEIVKTVLKPVAGTSRKPPAWTDPDDADLNVSLASNKRLRKLRDALAEDVVGGKEYERRLRRQYEKINPTPEWATKARTKLHPSKQKRRRSSVSSSEDSPYEDETSNLVSSTGGILGQRSKTLQQGILSIERLRDANLSARSEGAVKAVQFHPSAHIPVMLTASEDRRLRLFNVSVPLYQPFLF